MTNDNRNPRLAFAEHVYDYDQDKYHDLPDGSYVAVEDIPAIVAAELERLAESIDVTAPLGDLIATAEAAARGEVARSLIARAAELKAGA